MNREETIDLIKRVSNNLKITKNTSINEVCRIGIIDVENWEWAQGVGIFGLNTYAKKADDYEELGWIKNWIENNMKKGLPPRNINTTAPMLTVASIGIDEKNEKDLKLCRDFILL